MLAETIYLTAFIALLTNGTIVLFLKWDIFEYLQGRLQSNFFQKMLNCMFCISHHMSFIYTLLWILYDFQWLYIFVPLCVSGIINKIN